MSILTEAMESAKHSPEERRSGYVALSTEFINELEKHMREENTLFRSIRMAASVGAILIGVLTWIFIEKNSDIKEMQQTLNSHSVSIAKTLAILENQMGTLNRQIAAHEKLENRVDDNLSSIKNNLSAIKKFETKK